MIEGFGSHLNIELQQRAVEFTALFSRFDQLRPSLLERMPPMQAPSTGRARINEPDEAPEELNLQQPESDTNALLLLLGSPGSQSDKLPGMSEPPVISENNQDLLDLLGGLDGPSFKPVSSNKTTMTVHEKDQLKINFEVERLPDASYEILMSAYNFSNYQTLENFILQAAVPKTFILKMDSPSSNMLPPTGEVTQNISIKNPSNGQLRMRLRIGFTLDGQAVTEMVEVNQFPSS